MAKEVVCHFSTTLEVDFRLMWPIRLFHSSTPVSIFSRVIHTVFSQLCVR